MKHFILLWLQQSGLMLLNFKTKRVLTYSTNWYEKISEFDELQFIETFRMSKSCFNKLIDKLKVYGVRDLELKMYLFIFFCSELITFRKLREQFGLPKSTCYDYIQEISLILLEEAHKGILFPKYNEYNYLANGMLNRGAEWGCILAVDGVHIQCTKPSRNGFSHYNRHHTFSISFIAVCDYKKRFRGVTYNYGGSHDAWNLSCSNLCDLIEGISDSRFYILGDSAFSGITNIRTTMSTNSNPITRQQQISYAHQRVIVENAFALFKGKWKRFDGRTINGGTDQNIRLVYGAMFIHNFIIDHDE